MIKKHKLYDENLKKKILLLAKNIVEKRIPIKCSDDYLYLLKKMACGKINSNDLKIMLCEDHCLSIVFERAVKFLSKFEKENE